MKKSLARATMMTAAVVTLANSYVTTVSAASLNDASQVVTEDSITDEASDNTDLDTTDTTGNTVSEIDSAADDTTSASETIQSGTQVDENSISQSTTNTYSERTLLSTLGNIFNSTDDTTLSENIASSVSQAQSDIETGKSIVDSAKSQIESDLESGNTDSSEVVNQVKSTADKVKSDIDSKTSEDIETKKNEYVNIFNSIDQSEQVQQAKKTANDAVETAKVGISETHVGKIAKLTSDIIKYDLATHTTILSRLHTFNTNVKAFLNDKNARLAAKVAKLISSKFDVDKTVVYLKLKNLLTWDLPDLNSTASSTTASSSTAAKSGTTTTSSSNIKKTAGSTVVSTVKNYVDDEATEDVSDIEASDDDGDTVELADQVEIEDDATPLATEQPKSPKQVAIYSLEASGLLGAVCLLKTLIKKRVKKI